jgi:hypothetical protein
VFRVSGGSGSPSTGNAIPSKQGTQSIKMQILNETHRPLGWDRCVIGNCVCFEM